MSTLVREPNTEPVAQFVTPFKGTWSSLPANMLQGDQLYDSFNVFIREGKLRERPGLPPFNDIEDDFVDDVIGGSSITTPTVRVVLAFTKGALYRLDETSPNWIIDSTVQVAVSDDAAIDLAFLETDDNYVTVVSSHLYPFTAGLPLKKWIYGQGLTPIIATEGTPPSPMSICTAASRIVALVNHHTVVWSDTLTYDKWPALSYNRKASETSDGGVAVRSIGSYDFVIYKERSIYLARATGSADGNAFAIQRVQMVEGPARSHAIVDVGGYHMYMTITGRIGVFDGTSYVKWIADGLWFYLQKDIDFAYAHRIKAVFDYSLHMVSFHYPKVGDNGKVRGLVLVNIPLDASGITDYSCFLGYTSVSITYGTELKFNRKATRSILFSSDDNVHKSLLYDEAVSTDNTQTYRCAMQTGLAPMPKTRLSQVVAEVFIERADGNGVATVSMVGSDVLESPSGKVEDVPSETINLEFNPVGEYIGFNNPSRFAGLRIEWLSNSHVRYVGAVLHARVVG